MDGAVTKLNLFFQYPLTLTICYLFPLKTTNVNERPLLCIYAQGHLAPHVDASLSNLSCLLAALFLPDSRVIQSFELHDLNFKEGISLT